MNLFALPVTIKNAVLALGSNTKNTVCFVKGRLAQVSAVRADLGTVKDLGGFEKEVRFFLKQKPRIIAHDLHPEYQSTKFAFLPYALCPMRHAIQHHHAHIASCMAENGLKNQKVIGVAFDGTGFGDDNTLWGAEFLVSDYKNYVRCGHLAEIPLLGGEKAIQEPWRLAACWLYRIYKDNFLDLGIDFSKGVDKKKWRTLKTMYASGFNAPLASSMGRLFDAVASIVLAKYTAKFEAELAIDLERAARAFTFHHCLPPAGEGRRPFSKGYAFAVRSKERMLIIDPVPMLRAIVKDLKAKKAKEEIAYRFHLTVAEMIRADCLRLKKSTSLNKVVLSGGVFQNKILLNKSSELLYKEGFKVITHRALPCNDACVSLGQAVIASFRSSSRFAPSGLMGFRAASAHLPFR